jgi:hypothetical protein
VSYTREVLSGSTNGRGIKVTGTGTGSSVTIHIAQSGTTFVDIITLYAYNSDTVARTLTIEWGGTTAPDDNIKVDVPPLGAGLIPVTIDLALANSLVVKAFCETANVVVIFGYINREA